MIRPEIAYPLSDLALARRLERTEAQLNAAFVEARAAVEPGEEDLWAETAAQGWGETADLAGFVRKLGAVAARSKGSLCLLAELAGKPIASAPLGFEVGVAILAGASTIPSARNRGAQRALLQVRLQIAAERGCELVMMGGHPGSTSQRNAERQGFRIAYTRIKWQLRRGGA